MWVWVFEKKFLVSIAYALGVRWLDKKVLVVYSM